VAGAPEPAADSEIALIQAAQRRDHEAFERLVRKHDRAILRLAYNLLRSDEDARDAYQEVFLRAYRSLGSFSFQSSFQTWLYRIATNVCLDMLRRRSVRKEVASSAANTASREDALQQAPDPSVLGNPEREARRRELGATISRALRDLTPRERLVFELRHYEGLRLRAIGNVLSISEEAAKNSLFRATRKLRQALQDA
jgi:RNA polymerase sigma-70 factor (ECF subfamily)